MRGKKLVVFWQRVESAKAAVPVISQKYFPQIVKYGKIL